MKKAFALLFASILIFCLVGCSDDTVPTTDSTNAGTTTTNDKVVNPDTPPVKKEGLNLILDSSLSAGGFLVGELSIDKVSGEYTLYFGDSEGKALKGYTKIGTAKENEPFKADGLVIPPEAKSIIAVGENNSYIEKIPDTYLLNKDNAFIFGALSDIHFNKYKKIAEDDAIITFDNALNYYEEIGADMVGVAGDISNNGELSALTKYNEAIANRSFPVFTVTGNHDYNAYVDGSWQEYISANIKNCEFAPNGLDFVYKPEKMGGDVFVFLNITFYSYSYYDKTKPVVSTMEQIPWLEEVFKSNTEGQIYLFFHLFMCGPDGETHTGVGNIMNPGGYTYPLPFKLGNSDERKMRSFFKKYKNVVYLSGHSHWAFEMERYNEETNFSNFDGEYCHMVHIPSVTEPRWIEDNDKDRTGKNGELSQGWTIYDYGDTVIFVPIDFLTGTIYTEYMEIIRK